MEKKKIALFAVFAGILIACTVCWFVFSRDPASGAQEEDGDGGAEQAEARSSASAGDARATRSRRPGTVKDAEEDSSEEGEDGQMDDGEGNAEPTEEEKRADAEEALVDAFDALTDKWMEPVDDGIAMEDIQKFVEQFRKIPQERKGECLQRALNLVPDENVMLLAGILMDKTQDKEYLELIYNDVLNRGEEVKQPILQQIFKDRTHPCWADTAWILDVTGELPDTNANQQ